MNQKKRYFVAVLLTLICIRTFIDIVVIGISSAAMAPNFAENLYKFAFNFFILCASLCSNLFVISSLTQCSPSKFYAVPPGSYTTYVNFALIPICWLLYTIIWLYIKFRPVKPSNTSVSGICSLHIF